MADQPAPETLPPIPRPNGKPYRPRRLVAAEVTDDGDLTGVVVLGTHDPETAQPVADGHVGWLLGAGYVATDPVTVWWRDGFRDGRREWADDDEHGRAGVWFRNIAEVTT